MTRRALGLDGCPAGWVAVLLADGVVEQVQVIADVDAALAWAGRSSVGIDMPIGLLEAEPREADAAARSRLPGRASSVFSAPPRPVVEAYAADPGLTYADANVLAREVAGRGISQQTWRLVPRILEVDRAAAAGADLLEVHPEVAFAELWGAPPPRKTSWPGFTLRSRLLGELGVHLPERFEGDERCAPHDVLDAAVVAWVADATTGELETLPRATRQRAHGRPIVIHSRPRPASATARGHPPTPGA